MKKYAVTTTKFEGTVIYGFADNGWLALVEIDGVHEPHAHRGVCSALPKNEAELHSWVKGNPTMHITVVVEDLTFESFWIKYNYKVGKTEAEAAWKKLNNADKTKAISNIPKYDRYVKGAGIAKAYAQKYLNKRRFEDEY
jgi:hypothetical protein